MAELTQESELNLVVWILGGFYVVLVFLPIIQLLRIHLRVPDLGWTTQKLFLFLTLLSSLVRCTFFALVPYIHGDFFMVNFENYPVFTILDTLPSILFFSTYTLLILFWAEIIHHARNQSLSFPQKLRPIFMTINMVVYLVLVACWLLLFFLYQHTHAIDIALNMYLAVIYLSAGFGFVVYGGRLYMMLKQFPIESRGRRSKLKEVGWVTVICTTCFILRAGLLIFSTFDLAMDVNDYFIGAYYLSVEVVPSALVLFILRKLPPKKDGATPGSTPRSGTYSRLSSNPGYDRYGSEHYQVKIDADVS